MARVKRKKRKAEKNRDSGLETFLRFEIVVALFALIGFYYFLSFSPVRMPREPIRSPCQLLAPLPPAPKVKTGDKELAKPAAADESGMRSPVTGGENPSAAAVSEANPAPPPGLVQAPEPVPAAVSGSGDRNELVTEEVRETTLPVTPVAGPAATPTEEAQPSSGKVRPLATGDKPGNKPERGTETATGMSGRDSAPPVVAAAPPAETGKTPAPVEVTEAQAEKSLPPVVVEVGDYVLPGELRRACSRLEKLGLVYRVESKRLPTPMYRVYLGPFRRRDQAREMLARSREMGDDPFLDQGPHGYQVIISSFYLENNVAAWQKKYRAAGLELKVLKEPLPIEHKILVVESAGPGKNPETLLARLQAAGFDKARLRPLPSPNPQKKM